MDKKQIQDALSLGLSLRKTAVHLGVTLTKLYYYIEKHQIQTRSKSEAQKEFLKQNGHQRIGKKHSVDSKDQISDNVTKFWDSAQGESQKKRVVKQRRSEWKQKSNKERAKKMNQLRFSYKPKAGELSKFGQYLIEFFDQNDIKATSSQIIVLDHCSDIILEDFKIVIELIPPVFVYGQEAENKVFDLYTKITKELNKLGYKVLIIEQVSTGLSRARCNRVLTEILNLTTNKTIQS